MNQIEQQQVEQVSVESDTFSVDVVADATVDAGDLHETITDIADTFDVTGFKCVKCGLAHMHDTTKHQLSKEFDISDDDSAEMEYNPVCHLVYRKLVVTDLIWGSMKAQPHELLTVLQFHPRRLGR